MLLVLLVLASSCRATPEQLTVQGRTITVFNDSSEAWNSIEVWVNDHYRATRETMAPGERFVMPVDRMTAGFGQRFTSNQQITGIEVTATDASGDPVKIVWGNGRRR